MRNVITQISFVLMTVEQNSKEDSCKSIWIKTAQSVLSLVLIVMIGI